ncbi:MAG: glycosyltransferase [Pseudolysinimonas sp.]|uniref:glycosyltransferase n=1 Tax=Pseudolysinimonas sp. TaxID=2680009 RepID=UPI00326425B7
MSTTQTASVLSPAGAPSFEHLAAMTTPWGLFEHARLDAPMVGEGYCVDDVARALVVMVREGGSSATVLHLTEIYLSFLEDAISPEGLVHNRMAHGGAWTDAPSIGDWWGRAVGALGFTAAHATDPFHRTRATYAFLRAAAQRSPDVRASAFAAIGAAELLKARPDADGARMLLEDSLANVPIAPGVEWPWPESRLRYANATLCEALIIGGQVLGLRGTLKRGLEMLAFLLELETGPRGRLSVTGSAGRGSRDTGPLWDQQPIETAALADACARAFEATGDVQWLHGVDLAWNWFLGANDSDIPMYDAASGAGYDGLTPTGRNENRGAESTIAALSTLQRARSLGLLDQA